MAASAYETPASSLSLPNLAPIAVKNLSQSQAKAFSDLKALCEKNKLYWPVSELEGQPAEGANNDIDLLRFLHARNYDATAAYKQYSASAAWRRKTNLDNTYDNVDIHKFGRMNRVQPQWTGRRDKHGVPVMVYVLSQVRPEDLTQIGKEDPQLSEIFLAAEYVTRFTQRLCTRLPHSQGIEAGGGRTIDKSVNIIDLSNVGLAKFWKLRGLLQTASSMATAHYPETVERIFVVGAPYFFPTVWALVTRWFDPNTTKKIFVLSSREQKETLLKHIKKEDLPVRFGGELEWQMGDHPLPDDETKAMVGKLRDEWVEGPIRYIPRPGGDVLMAIGSVDGQLRREILAEYPPVRPGNSTMATGASVLSAAGQNGPVLAEGTGQIDNEEQHKMPSGQADGMADVTDGLGNMGVSEGKKEVAPPSEKLKDDSATLPNGHA